MEGLVERLKSAYGGKRVLITGDTGFKGTWLKQILEEHLGAIAFGYSLPAEEFSHYQMLGMTQEQVDTDRFWYDIRDLDRLKWAIDIIKPEIVFHLAAQSLVRRGYREPVYTHEVNAIGTANLLEALREKPVPTVIITTDKVYENLEWNYPYRETDPLGGYDPYSASKAAAEIIVSSYRRSFFGGEWIASARAGNVIGGGDWSEDRLMADFARAYSKGGTLQLRNPKSVRPWQHVLEPLIGYLQLGMLLMQDRKAYAHAYNFGPESSDTLTVGEVINQAHDIWPVGSYQFQPETNAPHEAGLLRLDISKAMSDLNWKPRLRSEEAIRWTIEWYKSYYSGNGLLTNPQIEKYFTLLP